MMILNKMRKLALIRFYVGFLLVGLFFTAVGAFVLTRAKPPCGQTEARIVQILEEPGYDGDLSHRVFMDYEVDGVLYEHIEFNSYSSSMREGDVMTVNYHLDDPTVIEATDTYTVVWVFLAVGVIATLVSLVQIVRTAKKNPDEMNEYDRVDMENVSEAEVEAIRESHGALGEGESYFFRFDRHFKQGYVMENEAHEPVYEAKVEKMPLFVPATVEFINHLTGRRQVRKIGHVVTTNVGSDHMNMTVSKRFKIDGQNNWDFLAAAGYSFDMSHKGTMPCFDIKRYGVTVATAETAGANLFGDEDVAGGNLIPINGFYRVTCLDEDLDMVFMVCFCIAKAIFYQG